MIDLGRSYAKSFVVHSARVGVRALALALLRKRDLHHFSQVLDARERACVERLHDRQRQIAYIAAHGLLRFELADVVGMSADRIRIEPEPTGKPSLRTPSDATIGVSLSHARGFVAVAIGAGLDVGVDVEAHADCIDAGKIARRFFTTDEMDQVAALEEPERTTRFLELWTIKEAVLKASGHGMRLGIGAVEVGPGGSLERVARELGRVADWQVETGEALPGMTLAVATRLCGTNRSLPAL